MSGCTHAAACSSSSSSSVAPHGRLAVTRHQPAQCLHRAAPGLPLRLQEPSPVRPRSSCICAARSKLTVAEELRGRLSVDSAVQASMEKVASARSALFKEARLQWQRYQRALEDSPVSAKALTSLVGLLVADCIAQAAEPGSYDAMRTARMATFGLCWHGVSGHYWYQLLDRIVWPSKPKASATIVTKMLADQLLWAPLNTAIFYASLAMMSGDMASIPGTLDAKLLPTVLAGYMIWPLAHLINFKFVPEKNRLLYINVVNLFWSIYLAHMANSSSGMNIHVPRPQLPTTVIPVSNLAPPPPPPPQLPTA